MHGVLDRHWMFMMQRSRMDQMAHVMSGVGDRSRMTMVGHEGSSMVTMVAVVAKVPNGTRGEKGELLEG